MVVCYRIGMSQYLSLAVPWQTPLLLSILCKKPPSFWWGLFFSVPYNRLTTGTKSVRIGSPYSGIGIASVTPPSPANVDITSMRKRSPANPGFIFIWCSCRKGADRSRRERASTRTAPTVGGLRHLLNQQKLIAVTATNHAANFARRVSTGCSTRKF